MKKNRLFFVFAALFMAAAVMVSCQKEEMMEQDLKLKSIAIEDVATNAINLINSANNPVTLGNIVFSEIKNPDGNTYALKATVTMLGTNTLSEIRYGIKDDPKGFNPNKGNGQISQNNIGDKIVISPAASVYEFQLDLGDVVTEENPSVTRYVAIWAAVNGDVGAWGKVKQASFAITVKYDQGDEGDGDTAKEEDTAYAWEEGATTLQSFDGNSKWGWVLGPISDGKTTYTLRHSDSGNQNSTVDVGTVELAYGGGVVTATFEMAEGYEYVHAQVYIGSDPNPYKLNENGKRTGSIAFISSTDDNNYVFKTNATGDIYFVGKVEYYKE